MGLARRLRGQGGYSLTEVMVAGVILAVALIPLAGSFDTSVRGIIKYEKAHQGTNCARSVIENIRSIPFYVPFNGTARDIDDFYWGERDPIYDNPAEAAPGSSLGSSPDWDLIPEVPAREADFPPEFRDRYEVTVQLSYIDANLKENPESYYEDTEMKVAQMSPDWTPAVRPVTSDNQPLHLLLVRVNVYWPPGTREHREGLEQMVSDSETLYHLGITKVVVEDSNNLGVKDPDRENAASHYPYGDIKLHIYGYGFSAKEGVNPDPNNQGTTKVYLVRSGYPDILVEIIEPTLRSGEKLIDSYVAEDEEGNTRLEGLVNLCDPYGTNSPSNPDPSRMAAVGYWSVRVSQEYVVNSFLFNGFIVEYPRPTVTEFGNDPDLSKSGSNSSSAKRMLVRGRNFVDFGAGRRPTPELVRFGAENQVLDHVAGTVESITGTVNYGYSDSLQTMTVTFDLTRISPGEYYMVVHNMYPGLVGHVYARSSDTYTVGSVPPLVERVCITDLFPATGLIYKDVPYGGTAGRVSLTIEGNFFNAYDPYVEVYLSDSDVLDESAGDPLGGTCCVQGDPVSVGRTFIVAEFDVSGLPEASDAYRVYVKNLDTGLWGWSSKCLSVGEFAVESFSTTGTEGFWENYYDIPCRVTGKWLQAPFDVAIASGSTVYTDIDYTMSSGTTLEVTLNLIGCPSGTWELRVYATPDYYEKVGFQVTLGPPVILPKASSAITITRGDGTTSTETDSTYATAVAGKTAAFRVRGKGFPVNGQTMLSVWCSAPTDGSWSRANGFNCVSDRANKRVYINSETWNTPSSWSGNPKEVYGGISVSTGGGTYSETSRWKLQGK